MEIILDSNIIIYFSDSRQGDLRKWLKSHSLAISVISQIEVLGCHQINQTEKNLATEFLRNAEYDIYVIKSFKKRIFYDNKRK